MSVSENKNETLTFIGKQLNLDEFIIQGLQKKIGKLVLPFKVVSRSVNETIINCDVISVNVGKVLNNTEVGDTFTVDGNGVIVDEKLVKRKKISSGSSCGSNAYVKMK